MVGGFSILTISVSCFLRRPLPYRSPVVGFLACVGGGGGASCFWNVSYVVAVDVVRVKSYTNSFVLPTCVPVPVSIN